MKQREYGVWISIISELTEVLRLKIKKLLRIIHVKNVISNSEMGTKRLYCWTRLLALFGCFNYSSLCRLAEQI